MAGKTIPRPKKVDSFFKGSPVEQLKVVDIYKESPDPDNILNSFQSLATAAKSKIAEVVKIPKFNANDIVSMVDLKDGLRLDRKALGSRLMDSLGIREGEIPDTAKDNIFKAMEGYLGLENGLVKNTLGKAMDLGDTPPEDASGFVSFLQGFLGDSSLAGIVDSTPFLGLLKGSIEKAVEMGLPDALDALLAKMDNEKDRINTLKSQVQQAALAADLETLKVIEKYMSREEMLAQCPEIVEYVLAGFRMSRLRPDATLQQYYTELVDYFNHMDPNWVAVGGGRTKLSSFTRASSDALTVFQTVGDYRTEALIARSYPVVDVLQLIKANYPNSTVMA